MKKVILFDYNGVIANDEHLQYQTMAQAVRKFGVQLTPELYNSTCLGRKDSAGFQNIREIFPSELASISNEELICVKTAAYQELVGRASILYPGAGKVFIDLARVYTIGIVTGSLRSEVEPVLQHEGILPSLSCLITAEDIHESKPNPEGYQKALDILRTTPEHTIIIEDSQAGVLAAKRSGALCIAVLQTTPKELLRNADAFIDTISELTPSFLDSLPL